MKKNNYGNKIKTFEKFTTAAFKYEVYSRATRKIQVEIFKKSYFEGMNGSLKTINVRQYLFRIALVYCNRVLLSNAF